MTPSTLSFRHAKPQQLAESLVSSRHYTLALFDCFAAAGYDQLSKVPYLPIINPPLWELGHTAWFAEWFVLREAASSHPATANRHSLLSRGDDWFDSNLVPHRSRWTLDLPSPGGIKTYCHEVLDRIVDKLERTASTDEALYPFRLVLAHEDMHGEALLYTLQTLGLPAVVPPTPDHAVYAALREVSYPGGNITLGGLDQGGFEFDNEKPPMPVYVAPFKMDSSLVSNAQFADFVADGGYQDRKLWSQAGADWLMQQERSAPRYWYRDGEHWRTERFGKPSTLAPGEPVRHVNLYEAQAYCSWAGRRLPLESEWAYASQSGIPGFQWGQLWEWTATPFEPHPGFMPDRYLEYSQPWFMTHQVLRGASFATPPRLASRHFRNFYKPERDDIFVGFRTCAF